MNAKQNPKLSLDEALALLEQRDAELAMINSVQQGLATEMDMPGIYELVGELMRDTFHADIVTVSIHDANANVLHFPYYNGDSVKSRSFGNGITEKIILSKKPLLINKNMVAACNELKAEPKGKTVESYLGVPIISGKKAIGAISVQSTELENHFSDDDLRLLTTIAASVGIAMQNAEAYQKLQVALDDLKATQNQLVQSEKMASLGELTAGIAHEIQNPLNFVNNFSEVSGELLIEMKEEMAKGDMDAALEIVVDVLQNLEKINYHGRRADGIVKGMLQHSRTGSDVKEPVDINVLTDEYLRLAYHGLRAKDKSFNVTLETDFDESIGKIQVVAQDMGRVILNLITNAFYACSEREKSENPEKFSDNKQSSKGVPFRPTVSVKTALKNGEVEIKVCDNGTGIPKKVLNKIFQPFFTTKPAGRGTGLGLSLAYDIVKAHGGDLAIHTKEGEGTEFTITLPK